MPGLFFRSGTSFRNSVEDILNSWWNTHLDSQYTVFGEVEEGLDVVEMIQSTTTGRADRPVDDIEMRMTVIE